MILRESKLSLFSDSMIMENTGVSIDKLLELVTE